MRPRIAASRFLIRLGGLVGSMAVAWMRPPDLVEFNRRHACIRVEDESMACSEAVDLNLSKEEITLLKHFPSAKARIILFGNGREKQSLTRRGHDITRVGDLHLGEGAFEPGLQVLGKAQIPAGSAAAAKDYDVAWLGGIFYSKIPGRKILVARLKQIGSTLKPGGYLVCQFLLDARGGRSSVSFLCKCLFAYMTLGNFRLQSGDAIRE